MWMKEHKIERSAYSNFSLINNKNESQKNKAKIKKNF